MDDRPFYYRVRGRTLGPVPLRQIRQLAQRAQIGRTTDISRDGVQWGKAGDWPEIFHAPAGAEPDLGTFGGDLGISVAEPSAPVTASGNWYYAVGGVQQGPVDLPTLQRMVAAGQVGPSDHVFAEGGADWMLVSSVPQLATGGMPPERPPITIEEGGGGASGKPGGTNGLAIAGFVLSLVGIVFTLPGCLCLAFYGLAAPTALLGMILSGVAMAGKNKSQRGFATAGLVLGLVGLGIQIVWTVLVVIGVAASNIPQNRPW